MSDDNEPNEPSTDWQMPEPVVRSTEGRTPGTSGAPSEAITDEIKLRAADPEDISTLVTEEMPAYNPNQSSGLGSLVFIFAVIAILAAVLVYALYYILSTRPTDMTF